MLGMDVGTAECHGLSVCLHQCDASSWQGLWHNPCYKPCPILQAMNVLSTRVMPQCINPAGNYLSHPRK
jgi:hypothetical protein